MEFDDEFTGQFDDDFEEYYFKNYFAASPSGQHLFFIVLRDYGNPHVFDFSTSLKIDLHSNPELEKLINLIVNKKIIEKTREMFMNKLFIKIKQIPGIEKYYFKNYLLDKYGRYSTALASMRKFLVNSKFSPLTPYSSNIDEVLFDELQNSFKAFRKENSAQEITKDIFEEKLLNDGLRFGYVDVYSSDARYFTHQLKEDDKMIDVYFMTINKELVFVFGME